MTKRVVSLMLLASFAVVPAMAQDGRGVVADKIVAVVGNSAILYSDVNEFAKQVAEQRKEENYTSDKSPMAEALETLMMQKLLYHQAQVDSLDVDTSRVLEMVNQNVDRMVQQLGSIKALEEMYHKPVYDIRENFVTRYTEMLYAQEMQSTVQNKIRISPGEVTKFYRSIDKDSLNYMPEQYEYAQIVRYPASTAEAKQRTREKLLELRARIMKGESFEMLARVYSADPGSRARGGEMDPATKDGFVRPFSDAMVRLRPGQVSEIVETEYGYHIIQMIDKNNNLYHVRHILMRPEFSPVELSQTALKLDSVARLIRSDSITFAQAAMEYSDDKNSKLNGGMVSNLDLLTMMGQVDASLMSTHIYKENLPRVDYNALSALKPGEVSGAFQAQDLMGNVTVKVLKLVDVIPSHIPTLETDYDEIERVALAQKQEKAFQEWLNAKIESTYVRIDPDFRDPDNFLNKTWLK